MSARTVRRAIERKARKAASKLNQTAAQPVAVEPLSSLLDPDLADDSDVSTPEIHPEVPASQATEAQIAANRENAKQSCGPTSPEGKAAVSQNRRSHGLAGKFMLLSIENADDLQILAKSVYDEHKPDSDTEQRLVDAIIQHYWLMQRAMHLQEQLIGQACPEMTEVDSKRLSLFLRYQTTHERSYYKAMRELQNIQKQKQKDQIGFESQKRQQESHEAKVRLTHASAQRIEIDTACRQVMEAPLPGNYRISLEEIAKACGLAIEKIVHSHQMAAAA
jgi:hypothetical protein